MHLRSQYLQYPFYHTNLPADVATHRSIAFFSVKFELYMESRQEWIFGWPAVRVLLHGGKAAAFPTPRSQPCAGTSLFPSI
jgi:hypothetical protein